MVMRPESVFLRMRRPRPWRNLMMASGRVRWEKGCWPFFWRNSAWACLMGWVGFSKGRRVMMRWERAGPGMSMPVQ